VTRFVETLTFFQPISNLTMQRVAFGGDERPWSSMRDTAFDRGLRRKMLIRPFARQVKMGITSEVLYQLSYSGERTTLGRSR
jgi:hypothetical protein